jgi:hypothetical protein
MLAANTAQAEQAASSNTSATASAVVRNGTGVVITQQDDNGGPDLLLDTDEMILPKAAVQLLLQQDDWAGKLLQHRSGAQLAVDLDGNQFSLSEELEEADGNDISALYIEGGLGGRERWEPHTWSDVEEYGSDLGAGDRWCVVVRTMSTLRRLGA